VELKITIKDESINGMEWALEAIMQNLKRERSKSVETPHGKWEYIIERRSVERGSHETNQNPVRPER